MNWDLIVTAVIAAIPATVAAFGAWRQARETHLSVNSRMDKLLALAISDATAKATLNEKDAEAVRQGVAAAAAVAAAAIVATALKTETKAGGIIDRRGDTP